MYYEIIQHCDSKYYEVVTVYDGMDVLRGRSAYCSFGMTFSNQDIANIVENELNALVKEIEDLKI